MSTAAVLVGGRQAVAQTAPSGAKPGAIRTYGLALVGDLALPAGFAHFPYVNPQAPKGGEVRSLATAMALPEGGWEIDNRFGPGVRMPGLHSPVHRQFQRRKLHSAAPRLTRLCRTTRPSACAS